MEAATSSLNRPRSIFREFLWLSSMQILACLFAILLLTGIFVTRNWSFDGGISRPDFLFLYALTVQAGLIVFRLEHREEVLVILIFHFLAMVMELFKTSADIGSWKYNGEGVIFRINQVPLFAGFLYSAVGSYIARAWRIFDLKFTNYPRMRFTVVLAVLAYINFFTHHFIYDIRWILIGVSFFLFGRCQLIFKTGKRTRRVPLLIGLFTVAFGIWIAENIGTYARAWVYPTQESEWHLVSIQKFWAWYLLMMLSFVLVSLIHWRKAAKANDGLRDGCGGP